MSSKTYVAFKSSERLYLNTDGFITRMYGGAKTPEPHTVEAIMNDFLDEALQAFFLDSAEFLGLGGGLRRVVHMAADTISKASHLIVKRTAKKLDIEQNRAAAEYMDTMRIKAPDESGEHVWFVAFPLEDSLAEKGNKAVELARSGEPRQSVASSMTDYLLEITDVALVWYFEEPMKLLGFGPIMRKLVDVGVETTRKTSKSVIRKVFVKLDDDQLRASADYIESLLLTHEPGDS